MSKEPSAISFLAAHIARRNNLGLFVWLCALLLPVALQVVAGLTEDVRDYLEPFYGPFTLYFFFIMTFSFATVFASYYLLGGLKRSGNLDSLRISGTRPADVLFAVLLGMLKMLLPPMLAFFAGLLAYSLLGDDSFLRVAGWPQMIAFFVIQLINVLLLVLFLSVFMYRGSEYFSGLMALIAGLLGFVLNGLPIFAIAVLHLPGWAYLLLLLAAAALLYLLALRNLEKLWQPQRGAL